ncbi:hypothetical protein C8R48DRAFT_671655 [Suillus tomentosus]|nr:hypothetical protein C8R48DRAFT_671655 [Suillus tomentosus]
MERATTLIFQPDTSILEFAGREAQQCKFQSTYESGTLRENARFDGAHSYLGNHVADYIALNAFQYRTFGEKIKSSHSFQLHYALNTFFSRHSGSDTPSHRFSFGSPILPKDARDIKSPCLVAFGRRNRPGPFVQEYQKFIAPSDLLASTSPPFFECEFPDLGRAIAQHHAALTAANHEDSKFSPSSPIANIGIPTPLPSPPRIGRRPISPLSLGEGTLVNIKTEPVGTDSLLLQQQPQPSTPDPFPVPQVPSHTRMITSPAQVTLIPATGRTEARDASSFNRLVFSTLFRLFSLPTSDQSQAFSDTRPSIPTDSGRAPFAPVPPTRASTPFSEQQPPLNLRVPGTSQLFTHVEAYECYECIPPSSPTMSDWSSSELSSPFVMLPDPNLPLSIADRFINSSDEDFDSSDDSSSTSSSEYFSQEDEIMDDMSFNYRLSNCDSQLPLGDVLIAADRITVGYTAMPDIIAYLSFEPLSNAMVADPPTYTVNVPEPFRGVHCGRDYRIALPFNGLFRPPSVHALNLTAALICSELDAHNSHEAGPEQAKFLAARPPTIYHYNKPNYPGAVVRGQSRLESRYYEWRNLRRLHLELLTAVHATLTPEQSKDCNETDVCLILIEDDKALPAWVNCAAFLLQTSPFCNPFVTRHESAYLRSAAGYFRFYGYEHTSNMIDRVLQLTVPDEDVVHILLQELLLDNLFRTNIKPHSSLGSILALHERKHRQDFVMFRPGPAGTYEDPQHYDSVSNA